MSEKMFRVGADELKEAVIRRLSAAGLERREAGIVADVLVFADLRGTHSHGVMRVEHYVNRIGEGGINLNPKLNFEGIRSSVGMVDARGAMGHPAARLATEEAIRLAGEHGIALVGVKNSSHCGALAYYMNMVLKKRFAGIIAVNTDKCVVPFGGREPYFGTNPLAFGFPGERQSILLDMATSEVAFGKIFYAREKGTKIPKGWAVDKEGAATDDPHAAHALFPFGGVKGYGINMMVEALTGLLVGGVFGPGVKPMYAELDSYRNVSSFHLVIDASLFTGGRVPADTQAMIDELHGQPAAGGGRVMVPGEIEEANMQRSLEEGVDIPGPVYEYLFG